MKIMVINPNSSMEMTNHIHKVLEEIKRQETKLFVTCPDKGPIAIESAYDETMAAFYCTDLVRRANTENYDAVIIACFSDPGLVALKEISNILVLGIQEVSMHISSMLGNKFAILTPLKKRIPSKQNDVWRNKLPFNLASVRELGMTVTETDKKPDLAQKRIMEVARQAVEEDGAEVIILGCAGMAGYAHEIEAQLGVPVIDPTTVTLKIVEAMVDLGLKHSKVGLFAQPPDNPFR